MKGKVCLFLLSSRLPRSSYPNSLDSSLSSTNWFVSPSSNIGPIGSPDSKPGPLVVAIGSRGPRFDPTCFDPDSTMFLGLAAKGHFVLVLVLQQEVRLRLV